MAYKIVIDAGHGGRDPGAVFEERQEKDDVLRLALAVGEILEMNGIDVVYTRTEDVYDSPYEKSQIANASGADYFISIHRNAMPIPGSATGIETLVYAQPGAAVPLAEDINSQLEAVGFVNRGIISRPGLVVLRRTDMPAVLVEVGFIDNPSDNALFDEKFDEIANAIADGTLEFLGVENDAHPILPTPEPETPEAPAELYRVQVGAYGVQDNAARLLNQLLREGFPAFMTYENGIYRVQVGAYQELNNAVNMEQRLRNAGYNTFITK